MKKIMALIILTIVITCAVSAPVWAGGGKVQHENGLEKGAGSDAQGNQVGG